MTLALAATALAGESLAMIAGGWYYRARPKPVCYFCGKKHAIKKRCRFGVTSYICRRCNLIRAKWQTAYAHWKRSNGQNRFPR